MRFLIYFIVMGSALGSGTMRFFRQHRHCHLVCDLYILRREDPRTGKYKGGAGKETDGKQRGKGRRQWQRKRTKGKERTENKVSGIIWACRKRECQEEENGRKKTNTEIETKKQNVRNKSETNWDEPETKWNDLETKNGRNEGLCSSSRTPHGAATFCS